MTVINTGSHIGGIRESRKVLQGVRDECHSILISTF